MKLLHNKNDSLVESEKQLMNILKMIEIVRHCITHSEEMVQQGKVIQTTPQAEMNSRTCLSLQRKKQGIPWRNNPISPCNQKR